MIDPGDLNIGNCIWDDRRQKVKHVNHRVINDLASKNNPLPYSPIPLTKEILKNNLGFEVTDFGEYWEAMLNDFVLHQPKMEGVDMPWIFGFKTTVSKTIAFSSVHHLQNVYYSLNQKRLEWKASA